MRSTLRASDLLCRLGGDEFAVMLPNTSEQGAVEILEKLSAAIESAMLLLDCTVTASIGAAVYGVAPPRLDEAIQAADEVMYAVKKSGKNQVRVKYLA
jgi:diguanylate cyclase (GGDEF)-like protein